ncbi:MAG: hypothetical protein J6T10_25245 [Methanobrevibacter sp.]|nr:hypothetical protein [Methanobrevibacter sp.]
MRKISIILIAIMLFFASCKPTQQTIVHHEYITHVKDSVVMKDSIVTIPKEVYTNLAWNYEKLHLETSLAEADAWVDSCFLRGTIKNKDKAQYQYITIEKVRDSIVYEKVPVPYPEYITVEKPLNNKLLTWAILASTGLLAALVWIFRKWIIKLFKLFV